MDRTYPNGVTCWVDSAQPDLDAAQAFYGELFGWQFTDVMPADVPGSYLIATLGGADVAALSSAESATSTSDWNTFVAVDDVDSTASAVTGAGGRVTEGPQSAGPAGSAATCLDPSGARFYLWQAGRRLGVQVANMPNAWNFSHLRTGDVDGAKQFYAAVFGWRFTDVPVVGTSIQVPGYGRHLADTVDPGIYERQAGFPDGFADVVGGIQRTDAEAPHWHVVFSVADRDASVAAVTRLGGTVDDTSDTEWTKEAEITDPQGARFTLSQFTPPS